LLIGLRVRCSVWPIRLFALSLFFDYFGDSAVEDAPASLVVVDETSRVAAKVGGSVDELGGGVQEGG
jgi:hypothetical protein